MARIKPQAKIFLVVVILLAVVFGGAPLLNTDLSRPPAS